MLIGDARVTSKRVVVRPFRSVLRYRKSVTYSLTVELIDGPSDTWVQFSTVYDPTHVTECPGAHLACLFLGWQYQPVNVTR